MDTGTFMSILINSLINIGIPLFFWGAVLVFSVLKTRSPRDRAERALLAGILILIVVTLLRIPLMYIEELYHAGEWNLTAVRISQFVAELAQAAGLFFVLYAFVMKFRKGNLRKKVTETRD